jgi:putative DNA primase/helicase
MSAAVSNRLQQTAITSDNAFLNYALAYAAQGWPVFPLIEKSKHPATPNGFKDASTDAVQIRAWWRQNRNYNVGLQTGVEFFVLDIDVAHGGVESLEALQAKHGALPDTLQQITGTAGRHYIFRMPPFEVKCSVGEVGPGLDIRGAGGYIVAPPSIHPVTKTAYDWDGMEEYNAEILPAPEWLLELLRGRAVATRRGKVLPLRIPHGQQHDYLVSMAGRMRAARKRKKSTRRYPRSSERDAR